MLISAERWHSNLKSEHEHRIDPNVCMGQQTPRPSAYCTHCRLDRGCRRRRAWDTGHPKNMTVVRRLPAARRGVSEGSRCMRKRENARAAWISDRHLALLIILGMSTMISDPGSAIASLTTPPLLLLTGGWCVGDRSRDLRSGPGARLQQYTSTLIAHRSRGDARCLRMPSAAWA